jgi:hypothetical protein
LAATHRGTDGPTGMTHAYGSLATVSSTATSSKACVAGHRVDRVAARPGLHHPGDQPHHPGQPPELDHEEGDQLAAIIAVPTAVTGFYGMNVPYPGFAQQSGFVASVVLLVVLSGGLYLLFRRLDWL